MMMMMTEEEQAHLTNYDFIIEIKILHELE